MPPLFHANEHELPKNKTTACGFVVGVIQQVKTCIKRRRLPIFDRCNNHKSDIQLLRLHVTNVLHLYCLVRGTILERSLLKRGLCLVGEEKFVIATTDYGGPITAIVGINNIIGTQFHPEKSQKMGLAMLENFLNWRP